jgi:hypothetical protein
MFLFLGLYYKTQRTRIVKEFNHLEKLSLRVKRTSLGLRKDCHAPFPAFGGTRNDIFGKEFLP